MTYKARLDVIKVRAIHPATGEIENACLEEDWFGPRRDAIRFFRVNTPHYGADLIIWEFSDDH